MYSIKTTNSSKSFKNSAFAKFYNDGYCVDFVVVLLLNDSDKVYYDNEKVGIPNGKCAR